MAFDNGEEVEILPEPAAWHIPCYIGRNCPKKPAAVQGGPPGDNQPLPNGASTSISENRLKMMGTMGANSPVFGRDWNLDHPLDWLVFIFLWALVFVALSGTCIVAGALFARECSSRRDRRKTGASGWWILRRPLNHFLQSLLLSGLLMAVVVVPGHIFDLLGNSRSVASVDTSAWQARCRVTTFVHLMSISATSWSIFTFVLLHHVHRGIIPPYQSVVATLSVWIVSGLLCLPIVATPSKSGNGGHGGLFSSVVDYDTCTLAPSPALQAANQHGGGDSVATYIYIFAVPYFMPSLLLTPLLIWWTDLFRQTLIHRDISSDYLTDAPDEEQQFTKIKPRDDIQTDVPSSPVLVTVTEPSEEVAGTDQNDNAPHSSMTPEAASGSFALEGLENGMNLDPSDAGRDQSMLLQVPLPTESQNRLYSLSRASWGTVNFLAADNDTPKILITFTFVHAALWFPFFSLLLISPFMVHSEEPRVPLAIHLFSGWLGFIEIAITPVLIYVLSKFVNKVINQAAREICCHCRSKPTKSSSPLLL